MARFQTYLADLLDEQAPLPDFARITWSNLADAIGITENTLKAWYNARVGSDEYMGDFKGATAAKIMRFFDLTELSQLVKFVTNETDKIDKTESPQLTQETASAALVAV